MTNIKSVVYDKNDNVVKTFEGYHLVPVANESELFRNKSSQAAEIFYNLEKGHYIKNFGPSKTGQFTQEDL